MRITTTREQGLNGLRAIAGWVGDTSGDDFVRAGERVQTALTGCLKSDLLALCDELHVLPPKGNKGKPSKGDIVFALLNECIGSACVGASAENPWVPTARVPDPMPELTPVAYDPEPRPFDDVPALCDRAIAYIDATLAAHDATLAELDAPQGWARVTL